MDMFSGVNNEVVMDVKDYIREKCGSDIAAHIEFYITFYERVLDSVKDYEQLLPNDDFYDFYCDVVAEV